jgi:hypothetical protein
VTLQAAKNPRGLSQRDRELLHKLDKPWVTCLLTALLMAFSVLHGLSQVQFNPTAFIVAGEKWSNPQILGENFRVSKGNAGYDGQFYYRLAIDPFTTQQTAHGVTIDNPPYRQQRILYPLVTWCLSLGQKAWVPAALIAVNFLALCGLGWLGGAWAQRLGQHALWGVLLVLNPGFLISLRADLTEILEITLLVASLLALEHKRFLGAALLLTLAILSKETALNVAVAAALVYGWGLVRKQRPCLSHPVFFTLPIAVYGCWQLWMAHIWGILPVLAGGHNVGPPLKAYGTLFLSALQSTNSLRILIIVELLLIAALVLVVLRYLRFSRVDVHIKAAWLVCTLLFLSLSSAVWQIDFHFARALSECYVLGALIMLAAPVKPRMVMLVFAFAFWIFRSAILV